jgi:hypothetical protein
MRHVLGRAGARAYGLAMLIAFLALAASPGQARAFSKAIWGSVYRSGVSQFPLYHQLGVSVFQIAVDWSAVAPTRPAHATNPNDPAYNWPADVDAAVAQGKRYGIKVLLQLAYAPAWANGGHPDHQWAPLHPSDFAAFATAAARRYSSVHMWMIWGEPTRAGNWEPVTAALPGINHLTAAQKLAPHMYAQLLDASYGALKKASKQNIVIGGDTYTTGLLDPLQWISNLRLPNGKAPRMDMYGHNPFSYSAPNFTHGAALFDEIQFSDLPTLATWVDRYLRKGMRLFLSEWTIPTAQDEEFNFWVDPPVAAEWITTALGEARRWPRIDALGWIHVYDDPPFSYGGLLTADGGQKPTFSAFKNG